MVSIFVFQADGEGSNPFIRSKTKCLLHLVKVHVKGYIMAGLLTTIKRWEQGISTL